jgi:hypothetical protein
MPVTRINLNGIYELDLEFEGGTTTAQLSSPGVTTVTYRPVGNTTHDEPLTDSNGNFIFAATLTTGGDIIVVIEVPN